MCSLPWNQTTPSGYFGEIAFMLVCGQTHLITTCSPLMLFISMCIHHQIFYEIFDYSIDNWNGLDANENDEKFLCDRIRFHATVKKYGTKSFVLKESFESHRIVFIF